MYPVSNNFKNLIKKANRGFEAKVIINEFTEIFDDDIGEISIDRSCIDGDEFNLGATASASMDLEVKTNVVIPNNAKLEPFIRMIEGGITTEWLPMGEFYIDSRNEKHGVWSFTCYDKLIKGQIEYKSGLEYPTTMDLMIKEIAILLGVELSNNVDVKDYLVEEMPPGTIRDVLSLIATSHASAVWINRLGELDFIYFKNREIKATITADDYSPGFELTNPIKHYTKLLANYDSDLEQKTKGEGEIDNTLSFYNPWITDEMLDRNFADLNGFEYTPYSMPWRGIPYLDCGDWVEIKLRNGQTITSPLLTNTYTYKGGMGQKSSAPSFTAQQSEFGFNGGLTGDVKDMKKRIGVYIATTNGEEMLVGQNIQNYLNLPMMTLSETSLEFTVVMVGEATEDSTISVSINSSFGTLGPSFKTYIKQGWNTVNVSYLGRDLPALDENMNILLSVDSGRFTVGTQQAQFYVYGANLVENTGIPTANVKDYINLENMNVDAGLDDNVGLRIFEPERIDISDEINLDANINVSFDDAVELSFIEYLNLEVDKDV